MRTDQTGRGPLDLERAWSDCVSAALVGAERRPLDDALIPPRSRR